MGIDHSVEILSLDGKSDPWVKESAISIHALGPGLGKFGFNRRFNAWLTTYARDYDVFVINGIWQYHSFAAHQVLKSQNRDYFLFIHGMLDPWFKHRYPLKHLKKCLYWPWGEYPVLRDARKVLFTCENEKIQARQSFRLYHCNEHVVNYGTAGHAGNTDVQRRQFLEAFPDLQGKRYLLFLSRIHPKKGVDILIKAFARTTRSRPDLRLVIAGPDQVGWRARLQKIAENQGIAGNITWTGMLTGDMKWGAYQSAEAFILPSHQENFGIVVAEALSCSLPVLISDKVNIWKEILEDKAGIVANDTEAGCIDLLNRWLEMNDDSKAKMRVNAHGCFLNHFEITSAAMNLLDVYSTKQ